MATRTKRTFGNERNLGDIIYNPNTKSVFCKINLGFFNKTINLAKRADNCYDLMVSKYNSEETVKIGQTFPVKKQDGTTSETLTQTTLGLFRKYDSQKQKEITDNSDALFLTTHKLKEPKIFGEQGFMKVGFITGKFGIEIVENTQHNESEPENNTPEYDDDGEQIPF